MDAAPKSPEGASTRGRPEETFSSPSAGFGLFGVVVVAVFVALVLSDGHSVGHLAFVAGFLLFAAVVVAVNIRPSLRLYAEHLLVRNALTDVWVAWASIEMVEVRQVMEIDVGDRVVRALSFGRTLRQQRSHAARNKDRTVIAVDDGRALQGVDYTDFVASKLMNVAESRGGGAGSRKRGREHPVVRTWRWAEVAVLVALVAVTAVLTVLAL
ncbi:MAG: hypothetical protein M3419_09660 [Actinomycetota bacterium]|nr:hypothetical protein [Actinomycetota bacterium]